MIFVYKTEWGHLIQIVADQIIHMGLFTEDNYNSARNIKHLIMSISKLPSEWKSTGSRYRRGQNSRKRTWNLGTLLLISSWRGSWESKYIDIHKFIFALLSPLSFIKDMKLHKVIFRTMYCWVYDIYRYSRCHKYNNNTTKGQKNRCI